MPNDYTYNRFAVSVNRKVANSVQRNYIKRVLRECFRLNQHLVKMNNKFDMWIVMKHKFDQSNSEEIKQLFLYAIKKINRI